MKHSKNILKVVSFYMMVLLFACDDKKFEVLFSYKKILKKAYKYNIGKRVPVTIEKYIESGGVFSKDGLYLFFASDREKGNFDIYLRSLNDITMVRITDHASKDTSPAISPDGRYLAFVSQREDPEGDIYVVKLNPEKIIRRARSLVGGVPSIDHRTRNITQYQDPETGTIKIIRDASPTWSPDGDWIAFSSKRDGLDNIWLMDRKGQNMRQITRKGGVYPRFSEDGGTIIYVSFRDEKNNGDLFMMDLKTERERRITDTEAIELYPSCMDSTDEVIYTLIDRDTNGDGKIDLRDNSVINYKNLKTGLEYPLTMYSVSSFYSHWSPFNKGIIIYSDQIGENININIIPEYGLIPKREKARRQYQLAFKYLQDFDDSEKYILALKRVYHFFGKRNDMDSIIFVSKALIESARESKKLGNPEEALSIELLLSSLSQERNDYRSISSRYLKRFLNDESGIGVLQKAIPIINRDKKRRGYIPYLMEDLGSEYLRLKRNKEAVQIFKKIITEYPGYKRSIYIHFKLGKLTYTSPGNEISFSFLKVLQSSFIYLKNDTINILLDIFNKEKNRQKRLSLAKGLLKRYRDEKYIPGLLQYIIGDTYFQLGNLKRAKANILTALKIVRKSDLIFYKSNLLLGRIAEIEKNFIAVEKYLSSAANNYLLFWKQSDFRKIVHKLIGIYEEHGERAEYNGNYQEAVGLYKKYVSLLTYLHLKKRFEDIYNEYAPRAHVLYIDAYSEWKGNDFEKLLMLKEEYQKRLPVARMDFDKAHIYGLGYIYTRMAVTFLKQSSFSIADIAQFQDSGLEGLLKYFKKAIDELEWALFIDDTFIDPYILKGWIYQYVDIKRNEDYKETGGANKRKFSRFFPEYLWESNISIYLNALDSNDEGRYPEKEGNIHLNIANTFFLLTNFPGALTHYELASRFKTGFKSRIMEAQFHYHFGYCLWQDNRIDEAGEEMSKSLYIYETLASGKIQRYRNQIYSLYRFFALFNRIGNKYSDAVKWYNRILEFSDRHRIVIDRVRYLQEIASCYIELGESDKALSYLDRAEDLLKNSKDDARKYYLKIGILGFMPFPVFNLGATVIGENRIFTGLDITDKKLLNASLRWNIYFSKGDYSRSIKYLKKKLEIEVSRDNSVDQKARITTYNNIGFCNFKMRRFDRARDFFVKAWNYASDPDVDDLEGVFISILNISNLYAFLLENGISDQGNRMIKLDSLIDRIIEYKKSYEENMFVEGVENLKENAEASGRQIKEDQIKELREGIARDASDKYYRLEIAIAVLEFQKAELLNGYELQLSHLDDGLHVDSTDIGEKIERAYDIYNMNNEAYRLYSNARKRFESTIEIAQKSISKRMMVKLLLNISTCEKKLGFFQDAYDSLSSAIKIAEDYRYHDLLWTVYYRKGEFLFDHGSETEISDYLSLSGDCFKRAIEIVEEFPYLYSGYLYRIKVLYDKYIGLLIKQGNWKRALTVSKGKYWTTRQILIGLSSPGFCNEDDRFFYSDFVNRMGRIDAIGREVSALLENGESDTSEKVIEKYKYLKDENRGVKRVIGKLMKRSPVAGSFFSKNVASVEEYKNALIYKFIEVGDILCAWRISEGRTDFRELGQKNEEWRDLHSLVNQYMTDKKTNRQRFVVLNETALEIFLGSSRVYPPFMFVPSIERVRHYISSENIAFRSIYNTGKGLRERLSTMENLGNVKIDEGDVVSWRDKVFSENEETRGGGDVSQDSNSGKDLSSYSVIIDESMEIESSVLFKNRLHPTLFIKKIRDFDLDYITLFIEASLYSGIKTLYLFNESVDIKAMSKLIETAESKSFDQSLSNENFNKDLIAIGFGGRHISARKEKISRKGDGEYSKFLKVLADRDIEGAIVHLNRWIENNSDKPVDQIKYLLGMAEIEFLREDYNKSEGYIDRAIEASLRDYQDLYIKSLVYKIYLLLYKGDIAQARDLLQHSINSDAVMNILDFSIFKSIVDFVVRGSEPSLEEYNKIVSKGKPILSINKLKLLYAEYLYLFSFSRMFKDVLVHWLADYPLTDRELLKVSIFRGIKSPSSSISMRAREIGKLKDEVVDMDNLKSRALTMIKGDGFYDSLSLYPVYIVLNELIKKNHFDGASSFLSEINIDEIIKRSLWIDVIPMLSFIKDLYHSCERFDDELRVLRDIINIVKSRGLKSLHNALVFEEARILLLSRKCNESFNIAREGIGMVNKNDDLFTRFQLLLMENEIYLGKIQNALKRGKSLGLDLKNEYTYVRGLLYSRIELIRIKEKGSAGESQWRRVENLIVEALKVLDRFPDVLKSFNRIDLIKDSLDFLISYKMSRKDYMAALLYAEIEKQLQLRAVFPDLVNSEGFPIEAVQGFKKNNKGSGANSFVRLLRQYPLLYIGALMDKVPVDLFRDQIPENSVVFYLTRNARDILGWIIAKQFIEPLRIKDGYSLMSKISENFSERLSLQSGFADLSQDLYKVLKPLEKYYKNRGLIIFIVDNDLEPVPFEIMGKRDMLEETHNIIYLSSIMTALGEFNSGKNSVCMVGPEKGELFQEIEKIAVWESGIPYENSEILKEGIGHVHGSIFFDPFKRELSLGHRAYWSYLKGSEIVYYSSIDFQYYMGYNSFVMLNSLKRVRGSIINNSEIHDVNNAIFVDRFYSGLNKGEGLLRAFQQAKRAIRRSDKYKHPAYWSGIRFYLNKI